MAGGQDEHPCEVNSSTTTGRSAAPALNGTRPARNPSTTINRDHIGPSKVGIPHIRGQPLWCYAPRRTRNLEKSDAPRSIARPVLPEFPGATFAVAAESASPVGQSMIRKSGYRFSEKIMLNQ